MAAVRVPRELAARAHCCHHLSICHFAVHCDLLFGDSTRIQALQSVQHHGQRHQDRRGRGAGRDGPVLHSGDTLYHLVHL